MRSKHSLVLGHTFMPSKVLQSVALTSWYAGLNCLLLLVLAKLALSLYI